MKDSNKELMSSFKAHLRMRGVGSRCISTYSSNTGIFLRFLEGANVDPRSVKRIHLTRFLGYLRDERKVKGKTIHYYFTAINAFYKFLVWEQIIKVNPVPEVVENLVRKYKRQDPPALRKIITVDQMAGLVHSIQDARDRALVLLLAKTGIRRNELITLDVEDLNLSQLTIILKPHRKRTNRILFIDDETRRVLEAWLKVRAQTVPDPERGPLFINQYQTRLNRNGVAWAVRKWATAIGIHDPRSDKLNDHFTPHCCRHWFTTHMRKAGMSREHRAWLRGDSLRDAQDTYDHVDPDEVKLDYQKRMPQLGF